jgi:multidrug efflux pump subunit AcrA (membrane-fusion protein)
VDLSFRVAGPLITRPVNVGDKVKQGDVVARIDPRDFEVEVRNAEGQLETAKAALIQAQGDYDQLLSILKEDPGATSQRAIDKAKEERERDRRDPARLSGAPELSGALQRAHGGG